jgi:hypothetical protein
LIQSYFLFRSYLARPGMTPGHRGVVVTFAHEMGLRDVLGNWK